MSSATRKNIQTSLGLAVGHEETEMKRVEPQRGAGRGGYRVLQDVACKHAGMKGKVFSLL